MVANQQNFNYDEAFSRNIGWVTSDEFQKLKNFKIAIGGLGGVGGYHLITLVRMGFQNFHISDFDDFSLANFNRQIGANMSTLGQKKSDVLKKMAEAINPNCQIKTFDQGVSEENVEQFLDSVDIYVDGLDFFSFSARTLVFEKCFKKNIPATTCAPIGMGFSVVNFLPGSMSFEKYFGFKNKSDKEKSMRFVLALSPAMLQLKSLVDRHRADFDQKKAPSTNMGCQFSSATIGAEVVKILLKRGTVYSAPWCVQYDGYTHRLKKSYTLFGCKNPLFILKLFITRTFILK